MEMGVEVWRIRLVPRVRALRYQGDCKTLCLDGLALGEAFPDLVPIRSRVFVSRNWDGLAGVVTGKIVRLDFVPLVVFVEAFPGSIQPCFAWLTYHL